MRRTGTLRIVVPERCADAHTARDAAPGPPALGIERQPASEPEDHAAALCETMALIISSDSEISIGSQKVFFQDHLGPWMGSFFRDMQVAKAAHFYRAVGRFGAAFIETEELYLVEPYGETQG